MLAKVLSSAVLGIDAFPVEVEVDVSRGLPSFSTVGLPDNAVKESKERVRSAIKNSGYNFPAKRITVNLAPADIKKEGTTFDLPVAVAILKAEGIVKNDNVNDYLVLGELSLDGTIKPVRGSLPVAVSAKKLKKAIIIPVQNREEAALVEGIDVFGVDTLSGLVEFFNGEKDVAPTRVDVAAFFKRETDEREDFSDVKGQEHVKRVLEVAAAGGHNVLMIGPPGAGKTMLARRLSTILPDMVLQESIETTKVHSVAGTLDAGKVLVTERPFRSPHHTISDVGLIGGGQVPRPGEVSLAHNGVLFLDELPEFKKNVLEVLRQPLEDGNVTISRAAVSITYPSSFMLVGAMNPCPCGFLGDPRKECACTPLQVQRYRGKLSGPLLDRIDIHCDVPAVRYREMSSTREGEPSSEIKKRINNAREIQTDRFRGKTIFFNSRMSSRQIKKYCEVYEESQRLLEAAVTRLGISATSRPGPTRGYSRLQGLSPTWKLQTR
jgi:magnesium chelatase family protein